MMQQLQRENRWWRGSALALFVVLGVALTVAAAKHGADVNAHQVIFADAEGKPGAVIGFIDDPMPGLAFADGQGVERATLVFDGPNTIFTLLGADGEILQAFPVD